MMQNLRAVLFPHSCVTEVNLKKVLSLFEKVTLFQPWFLEKAPPMAKELPDLIEVANPRDDLKPKEHFKGLLAEYRQWMRSNYDQGPAPVRAFALDRPEADSPTWEIRGMIRNMGKTSEEDETAKALKWHLALHLAEEIEEEQQSAVNLLRSMDGLDSPLKGALEEEDVPGLLGDLPGLESEHFFTEERLAQILDAWFALFGEKVRGDDPLITMNRQVMKYATEIWEEFAPEGEGSRPLSFTLASPDLSPLGRREFLEKRKALFTDDARRKAVADSCRDPEANFPHVRDLGCKPESGTGCLCWTFVTFPHFGDRRIPKRYAFIKQLSRKTLGLMGEPDTDGR
jgi:hypothetical protein